MKNSLDEMLCMQRDLDIFLSQDGFVEAPEVIHFKKKISAIIEVCEMLNEVEDHKFWKIHKKAKVEKAKEEWIDVLHFILSLMVKKGRRADDFMNWLYLNYNVPVGYSADELSKVLEVCSSSGKLKPKLGEGSVLLEISVQVISELIKSIYCCDVYEEPKRLYKALLLLFRLSQELGFKGTEDIFNRYREKNAINWQRKVDNY